MTGILTLPHFLRHRWGTWKTFIDLYIRKTISPWTGEEIVAARTETQVRMQERECEVCHYKQIRRIQ